MAPLMTVVDARAVMLAAMRPGDGEDAALADAAGRTLAAPILATRDQPPFDASAMDGWAVRSEDVAALPATLRILGESAAGRSFWGVLSPGEAVRIFTGAPIPAGADLVALQEDARVDGPMVTITAAGPARHIRRQAGDFAAGDTLLPAGSVLSPAALGLAAAAGAGTARCVRRPQIAILPNGAELCAPGAAPGADQIFESVGPALAGLAAEWGAQARLLPVATDTPGAIASALKAAMGGVDLFVLVGGASVGDHDAAKPGARALGAQILVEKIAVRPGKPTWFATLPGGAAVLGLPGNPASAQVCARLFLKPLIDVMLNRDPEAGLATVLARAGEALPANGEREHWMRARVEVDRAGRLVATAFRDQDSSLHSVLSGANALVVRAAGAPAAPPGDGVRVLMTGPL